MGPQKTSESASFRQSPLLAGEGFRHAFFSRHGGVSEGPFASLSFSTTVGDSVENVGQNLARAAGALGVSSSQIYFLSQVHGQVAWSLSGNEDRREVVFREGDAVIGRNPACAFGVRMADCLPILVADRASGAVAAIHAGWKGLVAGVIGAGVSALRASAGEKFHPIAAIGPHITVRAFEVSSDVAAALQSSAHGVDVVSTTFGPKPHVDLARIAAAQLLAAGVAECDVVPGCTFTEPGDFFSFRRDGKISGRHLAAIVPR